MALARADHRWRCGPAVLLMFGLFWKTWRVGRYQVGWWLMWRCLSCWSGVRPSPACWWQVSVLKCLCLSQCLINVIAGRYATHP